MPLHAEHEQQLTLLIKLRNLIFLFKIKLENYFIENSFGF
jgi:hypothetical protein